MSMKPEFLQAIHNAEPTEDELLIIFLWMIFPSLCRFKKVKSIVDKKFYMNDLWRGVCEHDNGTD